MVDVFRNRLLDLLEFAKNESPAALLETKRLVNRFFYILGTRGGLPDEVGEANISAELREKVENFLNYMKDIEDDILENQYDYTDVVVAVYPTIAGRRRKTKTRKHKKHTRKHYRTKGRKKL